MTLTLFLGLCFVGLSLGKVTPTRVMEAEDALDVHAYGGQRIPASFDPWDNQLYLREWRFFGWQLASGEKLEIRPILQQTLISSPPEQQIEKEFQGICQSNT